MSVNGDFIFHHLWIHEWKTSVYVKVTTVTTIQEGLRENCELICIFRKTPNFLCYYFLYSIKDKILGWNFNIPNPTVGTSYYLRRPTAQVSNVWRVGDISVNVSTRTSALSVGRKVFCYYIGESPVWKLAESFIYLFSIW